MLLKLVYILVISETHGGLLEGESVGGLRSVVMEAASIVDPVVTSCKKKTKKQLEGGREAKEDIKKRS